MEELDALWLLLRISFGVVTTIFVIGGVVRGLQMGSGKRPDLVTGWDNEPLTDVAMASRSYSRLYLIMAAVMLLQLVLLASGIRLVVWGGMFAISLWIWAYAVGEISERARKKG